MLSKNVTWRDTFDEESTDVADHGGEPVALFKGVSGANRDGLLAEGSVKATDDFVLSEQAGHGFFNFAVEAHVVVEVEILLTVKLRRVPAGIRASHSQRSPNGHSGFYLTANEPRDLMTKYKYGRPTGVPATRDTMGFRGRKCTNSQRAIA